MIRIRIRIRIYVNGIYVNGIYAGGLGLFEFLAGWRPMKT
jgi:hypothetical protein